jgi:hypothetical protein
MGSRLIIMAIPWIIFHHLLKTHPHVELLKRRDLLFK